MSIWAVLFALFTGLPLAYIIARYNFFGRSVVEAFIDIPIMIPHTAAGVALIMFFGEGIVFDIFKKIGITFVDTQNGNYDCYDVSIIYISNKRRKRGF